MAEERVQRRLAALLRKIGRELETANMEARAKAMRARHPEWTAGQNRP